MLFDYQKRNLKDFFKLENWDFEGLLKHCKEQQASVANVSVKAYYTALARVCQRKLKGVFQ